MEKSTILYILIFLFLLLYYYKRDEQHADGGGINRCLMTYMWRRMFYMDVGLTQQHPPYSLFLYGEGHYAEKFRNRIGPLDGLPVLFIPGHAGSGRQVRSLGSLLLNKTEQRMTKFHFDVFALDFNEELTALDFESIHLQSEFLMNAIDWIWSLYGKKPPSGIVLIGHSMGGIVVQAALINPKFDKTKIAFVLAFATPYLEPPFYCNKKFSHFWNDMHTISSQSNNRIISVSGGLKDEFIEETWTTAPFVSVHSFTSAIDNVWLDMDHKCILWCNQLVRQTSRLLFDYASDPIDFIANFKKYAKRHYESVGSQLAPLDDSLPIHTSYNASIGKTTNMVIQLKKLNALRGHYLLVISTSKNTPKTQQLLSFHGCSQADGMTRYLDKSHLFAFANFTDCASNGHVKIGENARYWIMEEKDVLKSRVELNIVNFIFHKRRLVQYSMENTTLAIIHLDFKFSADDFFIYRVGIHRKGCAKKESPQRIFFMENNKIRRVDEIKEEDEDQQYASLFIYPGDGRQKDYKIVAVDTRQCKEHFLEFSIDMQLSLVKALRRNRNILPVSLALTMISCLLTKSSLLVTSLIPLFMASLLRIYSNLFNAVFVLLFDAFFFTSFYFTCICLIRPLLNVLNTNLNRLTKHYYFQKVINCVNVLFLLFIIHTKNTSIGTPLLALGNLVTFNGLFGQNLIFASMAGLQLLAISIQAPAIVTYFWKMAKYGELRSTTYHDPFFEANCSMLALTLLLHYDQFFRHLSEKLCKNNQISHKLRCNLSIFPLSNLICPILFLLVLYRDAMCFFVMDDLSLLVSLFLIHFIMCNNKILKYESDKE